MRIVWAIALLALVGFADAGYIYYLEETGDIGTVCHNLGFGSCDEVLTSSYSRILSIPTAVLGIIYYLSVFWMALLSIDRFLVRSLLLAVTAAGFAASMYFVYLQWRVIEAWCPFCLFSAGTSTVIFFLSLKYWRIPLGERKSVLVSGGGFFQSERILDGVVYVAIGLIIIAVASTLLTPKVESYESFNALVPIMKYTVRREPGPGGIRIGPDEAPVKIQYFFDYLCPHCRRTAREVLPRLRKRYNQGELQLILKEFPLGREGVHYFLAEVAVAARRLPDRLEVFEKMMNYEGDVSQPGPELVREILGREKAAVILEILEKNREEIQGEIKRESTEAHRFGFEGTPGIVIDGIPVQGFLPYYQTIRFVNYLLKNREG